MVPLLPTHFGSQVYGRSRKLGADSKGEMWHCPISVCRVAGTERCHRCLTLVMFFDVLQLLSVREVEFHFFS